jgi:hypothetical protein
MRRRKSAKPRPGSLESRERLGRRKPPRMAARTANLAAGGVGEDVAAEVRVSVRKAASGRARRAAPCQRLATLTMPSAPKAKPARSRTGMDVQPQRLLRGMSGLSSRREKANPPTSYR